MKSLSMKIPIVLFLGTVLGCLTLAASAAMYSVDVDAPVVKLRISCTESGATLKNCFDTVGSLNSWLGTRLPSASKPLLVEIGPGRFKQGTGLRCSSVSHITYRGSGSEKTTIDFSDLFTGQFGAGLEVHDCNEISVENLTLLGFWGVAWYGVGNSTWNNVSVRGTAYGWFDSACPGQTGGKHYWFSSRVSADSTSFGYPAGTAKGYGVNCGQSWFFGSEILAVGGDTGGVRALYVNNGEAHVYGGALRAELAPGLTVLSPSIGTYFQEEGSGIFAALSANNAHVHIHGTGIDVIGNSLGNHIAALMAATGGEIHANGAAYNLMTGPGGKIYRLINNTTSPGHIHAPYLWEPHTTPPVNAGSTTNTPANALVSLDGADIAIETDCSATTSGTTAGCMTTGTEPHILIYKSTCNTNGPWWDVILKKCR